MNRCISCNKAGGKLCGKCLDMIYAHIHPLSGRTLEPAEAGLAMGIAAGIIRSDLRNPIESPEWLEAYDDGLARTAAGQTLTAPLTFYDDEGNKI